MADISYGFDADLCKIVPDSLHDFTSSGIVAAVSLNVNANSAESDLILLLDLSDKTKVNSIPKKLMEFENVLNITGYGLTTNENLVSMGIITHSNNVGILDFEQLASKIKSTKVTVIIKARFPQGLLREMIKVHINKSAGRREGKLLYYMEVVLKHPSLWKKIYGSLSLQNIVFTINIENMTGLISENMPRQMARQMRFAAAAVFSDKSSVKTRYGDMVREYAGGPWPLIISAGSRLTHLTSQEIPQQMSSLIKITPESHFEMIDVKAIPHMSTISTMPLPMYFPSTVQILIRTRLESEETTRSGTLEVDLGELSKMISQAMREIQSMGRALKDKDIQDFMKIIEDETEKPADSESGDGDLVFD